MTYRELKAFLETLSPEQLDMTTSVKDTYTDECTPISSAYELENENFYPVLELRA